mmetsp:Transcript_95896/g.310897  ORF Transcript_95896/g.310897 Transcript_95896/m.310897 type:complete len:207 (-) Transcript_95896:182-802(-)
MLNLVLRKRARQVEPQGQGSRPAEALHASRRVATGGARRQQAERLLHRGRIASGPVGLRRCRPTAAGHHQARRAMVDVGRPGRAGTLPVGNRIVACPWTPRTGACSCRRSPAQAARTRQTRRGGGAGGARPRPVPDIDGLVTLLMKVPANSCPSSDLEHRVAAGEVCTSGTAEIRGRRRRIRCLDTAGAGCVVSFPSAGSAQPSLR